MANSHYIPQFILKNFCVNDKITYCDLATGTCSPRNTRSVFSQKEYYPDEVEVMLSKQVEYPFANLYHNKLENARNRITLTPDELFTIKKYLVIQSIRYRYEDTAEDTSTRESLGTNFANDFISSLKAVISATYKDDIFEILNIDPMATFTNTEEINIPLWAEVKDVLFSYLVFVKCRGDEEFVIPDNGKAVIEGPMSKKKMCGLLEVALAQNNSEMLTLAQMLTPRDCSIFPLTPHLLLLSVSPFYKLMTDSEFNVNLIMPQGCETVEKCLGFGSRNTIAPPSVKMVNTKKKYRYTVEQLNSADIQSINGLLLIEAKEYVACANLSKIQNSVKQFADTKEYGEKFKFLISEQ